MYCDVKSQIYLGLIFLERDRVRDKSSMIEMVSLSLSVRKKSEEHQKTKGRQKT